MKHTPGPWHLGKPDCNGADAHMCEVMTEYATINNGATVGCYDIICKTWSPNQQMASIRLSHAECIANARLIAAAPDLLQALKQMLDAFYKDPLGGGQDAAVEAALDAVAKAQGEK